MVDARRASGVPEGSPPEDLGSGADLTGRPVWTAISSLSSLLLLLLLLLSGGISASLPRVAFAAGVAALGSRVRGLVFGDVVVVPRSAWHLAQFGNRLCFWSLAGWALQLSISSLVGPAFGAAKLLVGAALAVLLATAVVPRRTIRAAPNALLLIGTLFLAVQLLRIHGAPGETVELGTPLGDTWLVVSGGRSALVNIHWNVRSQRHALDLTYAHPDKLTRDLSLEEHPCWERVVVAPARAKVVAVEESLRDLEIGKTDTTRPAGNHVLLDIGDGRYVLLAHLRQDSVPVAAGDTVEAGQIVGRCGNSGNTSEPHLHIQVQDRPTVYDPAARTIPIVFRGVDVRRHGRRFVPRTADLLRNDEVTARDVHQG